MSDHDSNQQVRASAEATLAFIAAANERFLTAASVRDERARDRGTEQRLDIAPIINYRRN